MKISLIAAASENNVIGRDNDLPWKLPDDMKFFVRTTRGHHILTGRKNLEATGVLPKRTNMVLTNKEGYEFEGAEVFHAIEDAIQFAKDRGEEELMVIGGGVIYEQFMDIADRIYLTRIHTEIEGDTYFPEIDERKWKKVNEEYHPKDERHKWDFTFNTYERK
jgi:dihydrofolate reductase